MACLDDQRVSVYKGLMKAGCHVRFATMRKSWFNAQMKLIKVINEAEEVNKGERKCCYQSKRHSQGLAGV